METVKLTIDNKTVEVPKGTSILKAARKIGIEIPTLCHFELHKMNIENKPGGCRVCVVEVEGRKNLAPACATEATDGMVINTHNIRVLNARRTVLKLIISDHPFDCLVCAKSGSCELQGLATKFGIRDIPYQGEKSTYRKDTSPSIIRDVDKCIMCRRCEMMCNEVQTVGALSAVNRGFKAVVAPAFEMDLEKSPCTYCGQCVSVCPTGALTEVDHSNDVLRALSNRSKTVIVQTAPAVRAALGEEFGLEPGTSVTGKMVAALRRLGFAKVFDTQFTADLTIMEEGTELIHRIKSGGTLPMITSCSPGWINFIEGFYPDQLGNLSTCKSPQQMFGAVAKTWYAETSGIALESMRVVSIMPCTAKKGETKRPGMDSAARWWREKSGLKEGAGRPEGAGLPAGAGPRFQDVDWALTTRELARMIRLAGIDMANLPEEGFDNPLGLSTGAATIFGTTGGVMEAALRTVYEILEGKPLPSIDFLPARGLEGIKTAEVPIAGTTLRFAGAHGLGNARALLDGIAAGRSPYHFIEVMSCPGGCIGGGGQPVLGDMSRKLARNRSLYAEDLRLAERASHKNPDVEALYRHFLGKPSGHLSHELLHTGYARRTF